MISMPARWRAYMGRHIPGNPTLVPQNMPGAGGVKAMNYLYNVCAQGRHRDRQPSRRGLVIEAPARPMRKAPNSRPRNFPWIGSVSNEVSVCAFWSTSGIKTWEDLQKKPSIIGASAAGCGQRNLFPPCCATCFTCRPKW